VKAQEEIGIKVGDWIKIEYTVTGAPSGTPLPTWMKLEFLSVEGTTAEVRVTMHLSNGTELSDTVIVSFVSGGGTLWGISGLGIPPNSKVGDSINMGAGDFAFTVTIDGETTRTYAGASRTVFYASFSQDGAQLTVYWDKETGVIVEQSGTVGDMTITTKVTETSMWQATPLWMLWWFWMIIAAVIVAVAGTVIFLMKGKRPTTPPLPPEGTETISVTDE